MKKFLRKGGLKMAYRISKANGDSAHDIIEYVVDTPEDILHLPTTAGWGSICIVISTSEVYMKNSLGEWVRM
jgi:hypothetical protein